MIDVSNKTLAILFGIFVIISGIGLLFGEKGITGMVAEENETGNVSLIVVADVDINATDDQIDFGEVSNLYFNRSEDNAVTNGTGDNITIESIGTTVVDIDYWANDSLFDKLNGTLDIDNSGANADESYQIRIIENGTCGNVQITTYTNVSVGFGNVTNLIEDCNQYDEFTVGIQIYVPQYEPSGAKQSTLFFRAVEYTGS
jgi:hypothetical protein